MNDMRIVWLNPKELKPYENNTRKHAPDDIEGIKESIRRVGFRDPIGVWGKDNVIVEGHGRQIAAIEMGIEKVPCIRLDDMTDEQRREYAIRHNRSAEMSAWDFGKLEEEVAALQIQGVDLSDLKFDLNFGDEPQEAQDDEYDDGSADIQPRAKRGDVYQLGEHRLMCGDSTNAEDFEKLMDGDLADLVFTDPPYGVSIGTKNEVLNSVQKAGRCTENIKNDTLTEEELYPVLVMAMTNIRNNCKDDASYYVTSPQGGSLGSMMMMMKDAGLEVRHILIWKKNSATFSLGRLDYDYQHEPIFYTWTKSHHNYRNGENRTTIWEYDKPRKCDLHPTMKPVELVANAIMDGTLEGDIVLDGFGGSGTTLIAAEQTKRKARLMELDPHYVDVIIDRWEKFTGQKAALVNG